MKKQVILKIYGKVQGVFFRDSSKKKAEELNLVGWVRNETDETVQIVAEGKEEDLKKLVEWCRAGGGEHSNVEKMDIDWRESRGEFNDFTIR